MLTFKDYICNQSLLYKYFAKRFPMDISNAEFEVLEALWQQAPASANDIIARLNQNKQWQKNRENLT